MQTRDQIRQQVQNDIRNAVRNATNAARDAAEEVAGTQPALPAPPIPSEFAVDVLRGEIAATRAELSSLTAQLAPGLPNARLDAINAQIDRSTRRLESLTERLDSYLSGGAPVTTASEPAFLPPQPQVPPEAVTISIWFFATAAVTIVSMAFIRPWARWLDRRGRVAPAPADMSPRLDRIEQAIEAVAIEVERISEGQRFTNKLMSDARALPAPGLQEQWPKASAREPVSVRREDER